MKKYILLLLAFLAVGFLCAQSIKTVLITDEIAKPTAIENAGDGSGRLFILDRPGIVKVWNNGTISTFLDISGKVDSEGGENGLLGLTFHPDFSNNGFFYINYTTQKEEKKHTRISRYKSNGETADPASEHLILEYHQPWGNHVGGSMFFGNDGFLYISTGDDRSPGDADNNAQNRKNLFGNILRIDVNTDNGYNVPSDNPYVASTEEYMEEIYAYGFRNPWKISIDGETGVIWVADVGQDEREEINILQSGGNYGWNITEGSICFPPTTTTCVTEGFINPVYEYPIDEENCSVTGGYVYRGVALPNLKGKYIYGDFCSGNIWSLSYDGNEASNDLLYNSDLMISTFGQDENGEIYVSDYAEGKIYKLVAVPTGFANSLERNSIRIFPNPVKDQISISNLPETLQQVKLYNSLGKPVYSAFNDKSQSSMKINCGNFPEGMYSLYLFSTDGIDIEKITIAD